MCAVISEKYRFLNTQQNFVGNNVLKTFDQALNTYNVFIKFVVFIFTPYACGNFKVLFFLASYFCKILCLSIVKLRSNQFHIQLSLQCCG